MPRARSNAISGGRAPFVGARPTGGTRSGFSLGAHREELQHQQFVGNQSALSQEESSAPYIDIVEDLQPETESEESGAYIDSSRGGGYGVYRGAESEQAEVEGQAQDGPGFEMKSMVGGMTSFDSSVQRPNSHMKTSLPSTTFYADTDEKRAPYARSFDAQGNIGNSSDGSALNTIGAERPAAIGAKGDRHIFTMDGQGQFYTADAIKENVERGKQARDSGASTQERFHHSSFLAGEEVAGAGEMQVRDGQVELVSDTSGHYRPGSQQMMQTVQQLEKNNVPVEKLGVEFVGKSQGQEALQASAVELLGYQNHRPENAETQMRAMHGKKDSVLDELKSQDVVDGHNLKPSDIKRQQAAAPAQASGGLVDAGYVDVEEFEDEAEEEATYNNLNEEPEAVYVDISEEEGAPYNNVDEDEAVYLETEEETPYNNVEDDPYNNEVEQFIAESEEDIYYN